MEAVFLNASAETLQVASRVSVNLHTASMESTARVSLLKVELIILKPWSQVRDECHTVSRKLGKVSTFRLGQQVPYNSSVIGQRSERKE